MTLFIDATVRQNSRTKALAEHLLARLGTDVSTRRLMSESLPTMDEKTLDQRTNLCTAEDFSDDMFKYAVQFAAADCIVIAAPFWDMSFPAILKKYIEAICVCGITFRYSEQGNPVGLCKAKKLYYVTTAGGPMFGDAFGFGYVKALCQNMFGIEECVQIKAENLDIYGADVDAILKTATDEIDKMQM